MASREMHRILPIILPNGSPRWLFSNDDKRHNGYFTTRTLAHHPGLSEIRLWLVGWRSNQKQTKAKKLGEWPSLSLSLWFAAGIHQILGVFSLKQSSSFGFCHVPHLLVHCTTVILALPSGKQNLDAFQAVHQGEKPIKRDYRESFLRRASVIDRRSRAQLSLSFIKRKLPRAYLYGIYVSRMLPR